MLWLAFFFPLRWNSCNIKLTILKLSIFMKSPFLSTSRTLPSSKRKLHMHNPLLPGPGHHEIALCPWIYLFWIFHINRTIQHMIFWVYLKFSLFLFITGFRAHLLIHSSVDEDHSTFWLLWPQLWWTLVCKDLCESMFSSLLHTDLGVKFLGQLIILCLSSGGTTRLFPTVAASFPPPAL